MLPNLDVTTFLPGGLDFFGGSGAFGAGALGNLMMLVLMGAFGLYCLKFVVEALVWSATGSRLIGGMAGTAAFAFTGYLALVKVVLPLAQAWLNAMLAPLTQITSMMY